MATNDTDPQRPPSFDDDASRTEPIPPQEAPADVAAGLLADLAKGSLPTAQVNETEGHVAAAYAALPHLPPRANDKTIENPAVIVNATVPLPMAPSSGRVKLGPPAPSVVSMNGAATVPGSRVFESTSPGERAKNQTRVLLACIGGVVIAALIAIAIMALSSAPRVPTTSASSAPPPPSSPTAAPAPSPATPTASVSAPVVAASPPVVSAKPAHGARPHPSSRSSGTFADPDRTF